jgi:hypothetical protein
MVSTYSSLGFNKQGTGDNSNTWGVKLNDEVIDLIDEAIRGRAAFACSGAVTLTATNAVSNQARCAILHITSGTGGTVTIPDISKLYLVYNQASGNVVISASGGTDATIESGDATVVFCDGTNVRPLMIAGLSLRDYIAAATLSEVELPSQTGNSGKFIRTDGTNATWQTILSTDISGLSATASQVRAGTTTTAALTPGDTYNGLAEVTITYASSVAPDMGTFINAAITLTGDLTLANPSNHKPGQTGRIRLVQDGTGSRLLTAVGSYWKRDGGKPTLSTAASAEDYIYYDVISSTKIVYTFVRAPA